MKDITKKYSNGEITVVWKPAVCIHSARCFNGLPDVFDPTARPWITPGGANTDTIMAQIDQCPSGALSYYKNAGQEETTIHMEAETKVEALPNGPILVYGNVLIKDARGNEMRKNKVTAFCRCGQSNNKPFCDGSHVASGFIDQ